MTTENDFKLEAREILSTTRLIRRGSQSERVSLFGAILLAQADRALQGNDRAARVVLEIGVYCDVFDSRQKDQGFDLTKLEADELPAFERMIAKLRVGVPQQEEA
ncbi:hypothetical protein XH83_25100 [Bradyrhizobium sp. CCBAU 53351]|uniref:hypothetical protein n=1 Tax=Bradyrhizobium sp. CCBAU 53351 TaxID=1325114 RepID=UPI00188923AC|nr:hypothetical protein [Bradyrhizobium sp. CCBAU 53351]QOZ78411.1 hypothetical protein XH83_25100 [Bradyrhizobium sp. CCBAU 53351]